MKPKPFFKSATIVGGVLMLVSIVLHYFAVEASPEELAKLDVDLNTAISGISGVAGFVMVVIGRIKAKRPVNLSGK